MERVSGAGEGHRIRDGASDESVRLGDGESKTVTIDPEDAYGPRHEQLVQRVPRSTLPDDITPAVGMHLQSRSPDGQIMNLVVVEVEDESITLDANHPLSGQALTFAIELVEIL